MYEHAIFPAIIKLLPRLTVGVGLAAVLAWPAQAQLRISGEVESEFEISQPFDSQGEAERELEFETEIGTRFQFSRSFSLNTLLVGEAAEEEEELGADDDDDEEEEDILPRHVGFAEELYLEYQFDEFELLDPLRLYAGKFNPLNGNSLEEELPGVFLSDVPEEYELTEQIGLGIGATIRQRAVGSFSADISAYFADTTALSSGIGSERKRVSRNSGGAGNTEQLDNFAIGLYAEDIRGLPGFEFRLGSRYRQNGRGGSDDEAGIIAGVDYQTRLALPRSLFKRSANLAFGLELAGFENFNGTPNDRYYIMPTATLSYGRIQWGLGARYRMLERKGLGGDDDDDDDDDDEASADLSDLEDILIEASVGLRLGRGSNVSFSYAYDHRKRLDSHLFGFRFSHEFSF